MICILLIAGIFAVDYLIKEHVLECHEIGEKEELFGGRVLLTYIRNYGFAMSAFRKYPELVKKASGAVTGMVAMILAGELLHPGNKLKKLSLAMIVGGGASNLYDRVKRGFVVDYVSFRTRWKKLNKLVFNISDFFIIGGSVLYCITRIFPKKDK